MQLLLSLKVPLSEGTCHLKALQWWVGITNQLPFWQSLSRRSQYTPCGHMGQPDLTPQDFDELPSLSAYHFNPPEVIGVSCSILSGKHTIGEKKNHQNRKITRKNAQTRRHRTGALQTGNSETPLSAKFKNLAQTSLLHTPQKRFPIRKTSFQI